MEKNKLYFKGVGGTEMKEHEVDMELFKEIDVEVRIYNFSFWIISLKTLTQFNFEFI